MESTANQPLARDGKMRSPYPPLWQEHNDPTGQLALVYSVPGERVPVNPRLLPLEAREGEPAGPLKPEDFVQGWEESEMEVLVDVETFKDTNLVGNRRGIAFEHVENWSLKRVKEYFNQPRKPNSSGRPVAGQSQMPVVVGPFISKFRPRCVANLEDFPDMDLPTVRARLDEDNNFLSRRLLGFMWANTTWYRTRYNRWVMVEAGHVNIFVAHDLTDDERRAFQVYGREYPADMDSDKIKRMEIKGRGIMFLPPGARYKVVFFKDTLLSVGDLPVQDGRNSFPKLPTRYGPDGAPYEKDMVRKNSLEVCMRASDDSE